MRADTQGGDTRMHILIIGAAGMIGRKLTERLVRDGRLGGKPIASLDLVDVVAPALPQGAPFKASATAGDVTDPRARPS